MTTKKRTIAVLGATGSIGRSALDVIRRNSEYFEPILFSEYTNREALLALGDEFRSAELALSGQNAPNDTPFSGRIHYMGEEGRVLGYKCNCCGSSAKRLGRRIDA
jgi:1-deoxy-D-xylulose-5-phosphate reductoisomerase